MSTSPLITPSSSTDSFHSVNSAPDDADNMTSTTPEDVTPQEFITNHLSDSKSSDEALANLDLVICTNPDFPPSERLRAFYFMCDCLNSEGSRACSVEYEPITETDTDLCLSLFVDGRQVYPLENQDLQRKLQDAVKDIKEEDKRLKELHDLELFYQQCKVKGVTREKVTDYCKMWFQQTPKNQVPTLKLEVFQFFQQTLGAQNVTCIMLGDQNAFQLVLTLPHFPPQHFYLEGHDSTVFNHVRLELLKHQFTDLFTEQSQKKELSQAVQSLVNGTDTYNDNVTVIVDDRMKFTLARVLIKETAFENGWLWHIQQQKMPVTADPAIPSKTRVTYQYTCYVGGIPLCSANVEIKKSGVGRTCNREWKELAAICNASKSGFIKSALEKNSQQTPYGSALIAPELIAELIEVKGDTMMSNPAETTDNDKIANCKIFADSLPPQLRSRISVAILKPCLDSAPYSAAITLGGCMLHSGFCGADALEDLQSLETHVAADKQLQRETEHQAVMREQEKLKFLVTKANQWLDESEARMEKCKDLNELPAVIADFESKTPVFHQVMESDKTLKARYEQRSGQIELLKNTVRNQSQRQAQLSEASKWIAAETAYIAQADSGGLEGHQQTIRQKAEGTDFADLLIKGELSTRYNKLVGSIPTQYQLKKTLEQLNAVTLYTADGVAVAEKLKSEWCKIAFDQTGSYEPEHQLKAFMNILETGAAADVVKSLHFTTQYFDEEKKCLMKFLRCDDDGTPVFLCRTKLVDVAGDKYPRLLELSETGGTEKISMADAVIALAAMFPGRIGKACELLVSQYNEAHPAMEAGGVEIITLIEDMRWLTTTIGEKHLISPLKLRYRKHENNDMHIVAMMDKRPLFFKLVKGNDPDFKAWYCAASNAVECFHISPDEFHSAEKNLKSMHQDIVSRVQEIYFGSYQIRHAQRLEEIKDKLTSQLLGGYDSRKAKLLFDGILAENQAIDNRILFLSAILCQVPKCIRADFFVFRESEDEDKFCFVHLCYKEDSGKGGIIFLYSRCLTKDEVAEQRVYDQFGEIVADDKKVQELCRNGFIEQQHEKLAATSVKLPEHLQFLATPPAATAALE